MYSTCKQWGVPYCAPIKVLMLH